MANAIPTVLEVCFLKFKALTTKTNTTKYRKYVFLNVLFSLIEWNLEVKRTHTFLVNETGQITGKNAKVGEDGGGKGRRKGEGDLCKILFMNYDPKLKHW